MQKNNANNDNSNSNDNGVPSMPRPQRMGAARAAAPSPEPYGGSLFRSVSMAVPSHSTTLGGPMLRGIPDQSKSSPSTLQTAGSDNAAFKAPPMPLKIRPAAKLGASRGVGNPITPAKLVTQSTPYEWKVDTVPPSIPMYHPVDLRTSLQLVNGAATLEAVHETTCRLSKFMHQHSIHSQYSSKDNNENPFEDDLVRVTCVTPNMNHFCIQLWTLPEEPSTLIIEMQRRQGCCMEHQRIRKALYRLLKNEDGDATDSSSEAGTTASTGNKADALLNKVCDNAVKTARTLPGKLPPPLPRGFAFGKAVPPVPKGMSFAGMKPGKQTEEQEHLHAIDMCRNLLTAHNRRDQHELGLDSLVGICDSHKVSAKLAERASKTVVCPGTNDCAIQDAVLQYCRDNQRPGDSADGGETKEDIDSDEMGWYGGYAEGRHYRTMHVLALRIISQSLQLATEGDLDATFLSDVTSCCTYNLQVAQHRPLEAELSARCLRILIERCSGASQATSLATPPPSCVMDAQVHGQVYHAGLHRECGMLLQLQEQLQH
uniref:Uncharacterized protein n=1 Tax=Craspedostauros australis TaxID=1486917 RepID=A0A6T6HBN9_9STRA|mmetsp:Transcript_4249/g.11077  ORF Transcript_4249/g.11077 Transcript_4249/m.11077 type:complete len:542 (+) Transcript_4249:319-1944(+)